MYCSHVHVRLKALRTLSTTSRSVSVSSRFGRRYRPLPSTYGSRRYRAFSTHPRPDIAGTANKTESSTSCAGDTSFSEEFVPGPNMTLQQVHEARQAHAKLLSQRNAEARARAHEAKIAADIQLAERRKKERLEHARRLNVAKFAVPYLLSTRSDLFGLVMEELNLSSAGSGSGELGDEKKQDVQEDREGPSAQYKGIYMDSIPSFVQKLVEQTDTVPIHVPNDVVDAADDDSTVLPVNILLDKLADAGFEDPQFTKHHRQNKRLKENHGKYLDRVKRKIIDLEKRKAKLEICEKNYVDVKEQVEEAEEELRAAQEEAKRKKEEQQIAEMAMNQQNTEEKKDDAKVELTESSSPIDAIREGVNKLLGFSTKTSGAGDTRKIAAEVDKGPKYDVDKGQRDEADGNKLSKAEIRLNRLLRKLSRRLNKHSSSVKHAQAAVDGAQRHLEKVRDAKERNKPVLTDEEYTTSTAIAGEVMRHFCPAFASHLHDRHAQMIERYRILDAQTDLTKPHEWYPRARLDRRKIIYHGGPTNSGKTYTALQRLKEANKGLYVGPLRLLAAEIYEQLTSEGVYTNLFTGQEKKEIPFATHSAATVELAPLDRDFDVVVIDEIQMISDPFRGWAWTRALLGLRCKEIHVAGGMEARQLVERLAEVCGDEFEINEYERFSDLVTSKKSLAQTSNEKGSYSSVRPGDCVVAFSRNDIFAIKREIEKYTKHKCCVIYGSLPPQTRSEQARLFNDPDSGYDVLVASDAIGMGLNLSIKRIIFNSMFKSNGEDIVQLDHSSVKQISGRAGRRNSPYPVGEVTVRDPADLKHLQICMKQEIAPIKKAGLLPTSSHFELFAAATQKYNDMGNESEAIDVNMLHKILLQFGDLARLKGDFFLCRQTQMRQIAKWLDDLPLSLPDKYSFCMAPVNNICLYSMGLLKRFAEKYSYDQTTGVPHREFIANNPRSLEDLSILCSKHHRLELFLWLCQKFPHSSNMIEEQQATQYRDECISVINAGLAKANRLKLDHCYLKRDRNLRATWAKEQKDGVGDEVHDFIHDLDEYDDLLQQFEVEDI